MATTVTPTPFIPPVVFLAEQTRKEVGQVLLDSAVKLYSSYGDAMTGAGITRRLSELGSVTAARAYMDRLRAAMVSVGDNALTAASVDHEAFATAVAVADGLGYTVAVVDPTVDPDFLADPHTSSMLDMAGKRILVRQDRTLVGKALYIYYVLAQDVVGNGGMLAASPDGSILDSYHNILMRFAADLLLDLYTPGTDVNDVARQVERSNVLAAASYFPNKLTVAGVESAAIGAAALALYFTGTVLCPAALCAVVMNASRDGFLEGALQVLTHHDRLAHLVGRAMEKRGLRRATVVGDDDGEEEDEALMFGVPHKPRMMS